MYRRAVGQVTSRRGWMCAHCSSHPCLSGVGLAGLTHFSRARKSVARPTNYIFFCNPASSLSPSIHPSNPIHKPLTFLSHYQQHLLRPKLYLFVHFIVIIIIIHITLYIRRQQSRRIDYRLTRLPEPRESEKDSSRPRGQDQSVCLSLSVSHKQVKAIAQPSRPATFIIENLASCIFIYLDPTLAFTIATTQGKQREYVRDIDY